MSQVSRKFQENKETVYDEVQIFDLPDVHLKTSIRERLGLERVEPPGAIEGFEKRNQETIHIPKDRSDS
jgi:hypothetical protein